MKTKADEIPTGQLFTDLQVSLTEIFLIELLGDKQFVSEQRERLDGNLRVCDSIKAIMLRRFSTADIEDFLQNGYPRAVSVAHLIDAEDGMV